MNSPTRPDLERIADRYEHRPRWITDLVESGYLPKPRPRGKGKGRAPDWVYPPGTDTRLRALCRLHMMGYHRGALRFAWWWLGYGPWSRDVANYVAEVVRLRRSKHHERVDATFYNPQWQESVTQGDLADETAGDLRWSEAVPDTVRQLYPGKSSSDRLNRALIASEFGVRLTDKNRRRLLGALTEQQAKTLDQARTIDGGPKNATPFHPAGPILKAPTTDHKLGEYAKRLVKTAGTASPIPSDLVPLDPIGRAKCQLWAQLRGIRPPWEPAFDPDQMQSYLEHSAMQRQYLATHTALTTSLLEGAETYIRNADANTAAIGRDEARQPDRQRARRQRVKDVAAWLKTLAPRERGRQGIPEPGPALAERAWDVANVILGIVAIKENGFTS
jgi:hypothetical protein